MHYNIDFLIASLAFLILILYHYINRREKNDFHSSFFLGFILVGIFDIAFDIISTLFMENPAPERRIIATVALTVFYLLQIVMTYMLLFYTQSLRNCSRKKRKPVLVFWMIPAIVLAIAVVANYWGGYFFYFDAMGQYFSGPFYMTMYIYVTVYELFIAISSVIFYKELGIHKVLIIWEFLVVSAICVILQVTYREILLTGMGIGLGIMVLFLTLNNPYVYTDSLTGAFDNRYFRDYSDNLIRKRKSFHIIVVDLVRLKRVNAIFGSNFSDQLLVQTVELLRSQGKVKQVFRLNERRFLVMTETLYEYEKQRNQIQKFFQKELRINGINVRIPAVICGIVAAEELERGDVLQNYIEYLVAIVPPTEEVAMIQSNKETMKGFYYSNEIESFLKTAIDQDLFEVYYQPIISTETKKCITLEALSRLRHPSLGPVSPELFITLAERNGLISTIGYQQFLKICRFVKEHIEIFDTVKCVKINMSPAEILKDGYSKRIIETIRKMEIPYRCFQFEVTETVATEYSENLHAVIEDFGEVGIGLCLDDFGSGYANLNTVLKLPFSLIKLDRSLLQGIEKDEQVATFYRSTVSVLQDLGFQVIAEGVETAEEAKLVSEWSVEMIQGYYFSKPMEEEKLLEIIDKQYEIR